ncbi:hypothetical protein GYB29_16245 [bacterium]|nr:hypothetical protein [bacterium]
MIDAILSQLKDSVAGELTEKAGVSQDQIPQIMDIVGNVTKEKVSEEVSSGNIGALMNLFSDKENSGLADGIQTALKSGIVNQLAAKLGFDEGKAGQIANIVIPTIVGLLTKKNKETPDTDTSMLTDLLGKSGGLGDLAKGLGGLFN